MNNENLRMDERCATRCDHDSQCSLPAGHIPNDRHETEHGCICYDPRRYGPFARENRKDDELRFAPHGASAAECAVCGWESMKRVVEGDGFVPICSLFCLQAWPRVRDLLDRISAYEEVLATRREHARRADDRLNDALSGEADAVSRAESAELGCEVAYRREPTQAEGDAHEYRHDQSMGASECIRECHVSMGNHHGHRCLCGRWVWGAPTVCQRCVDAEAVKTALLRADTAAKVAVEWEKLFNERNRLWREEADRVGAVKLLLEANGCDCDCEHHHDEHDADCDRCLACRISWAIET